MPSDQGSRPGLCLMYGSLRSGTTMLRLMLDAHPRLVCPGETDFLTDHLVAGPRGWRYDLEALAGDWIFKMSRIRPPATDAPLPAFERMTEELRGAEQGCLALVAHRGLGRMLDLVPDLPVIHLVRDPRDVARSAIGMGWAGNTYYGAETWLAAEREWERQAHRLSSGQVHELRYEALVHDPEGELSRVCAFLGLEYDPVMLNYSESSTYERPDPALTYQWRRKQSPREVGLIEPLFGDLLTARGYEKSGYAAVEPEALGRLALWLGNKRGTLAHRLRMHGVVDTLLVTMANRTGLHGLARNARRRMEVRTVAGLK